MVMPGKNNFLRINLKQILARFNNKIILNNSQNVIVNSGFLRKMQLGANSYRNVPTLIECFLICRLLKLWSFRHLSSYHTLVDFFP